MANFWVAILSITLIVSVALFQIAVSPGGSESFIAIASKGIRGQEMVAVKHYRKRINQAAVTYSNHEQAPPKVLLEHKIAVMNVIPCAQYIKPKPKIEDQESH